LPRTRKRNGNPALVVGYIRVSTEDQALSTDAQLDALKKWCSDHDSELVHVCTDQGVSGAADLDKRPGLLEAIAALREYEAGTLLVFRLDRLSRAVSKGAMIHEMVKREGARVMACDGVGNDDSPEGELLRNMIGAVAQYERQIIAFRTRVALQAKKKRGQRYCCRAPFGWQWTRDGRCEEHPIEQRTIKKIVAMRAAGETLNGIVRFLNKHKKRYPTRSAASWHLTSVARILRRHEANEAA